METPNTADIWMRLTVPVPDDTTARQLMWTVETAVGVALGHHELDGRFEFVRFTTHPCETAQNGAPGSGPATPMLGGESS
jgi:hypothetical protein